MITINDIARLAGVAKSTVSRYLNGGPVGDTTKKKIEQVILETGYVPNTFAQSLKAKKTNIIGTIVPRLDSYAAAKTLLGIDEKLRELNCQMLISNTSQLLEREIESIYSFARQKVAGIILLATQVTDEHIEAFRKINIPALLVGQQHPELHSIIHRDFEAAYKMGTYILEKGHRKIAYLGVPEFDVAVGLRRKHGFQKSMVDKNVQVQYFETSFSMSDAMRAATKIIHDYKPSVIVCATDNIALGALKAAHLSGLKAPTDISVAGFGGYEITEVIHPGLTTVSYDFKQAGVLAALDIIKLIEGEEIDKITYSDFELIERESVDKIKSNRI